MTSSHNPGRLAGLVSPRINHWLVRHGLCPRQADRPRKRSGDGQQYYGPRDALSPMGQAGFIFRGLGSLPIRVEPLQSAAAAPAGCCFIISCIPFFISFAEGSA